MELIKQAANVQVAQTAQPEQSQNVQQTQSTTQQLERIHQDLAKENQPLSENQKINSEKNVEDLVKDLNNSIGPFNTSIRFGFDNKSDDFYVSVIEAKTNKLIRRFPAEQAFEMLPKIKDVSGLLFDSKG